MTKYNQDFEMHQGDTKQITITIVDENGTPKNLTGSTKKWEAYIKDQTTAVIAKTDGDISLVTVNGTNDSLRFTIDPVDTAGLLGLYAFEAEVVDASSNVSTVARGTMMIRNQLIS
jgi:hypothetical protein